MISETHTESITLFFQSFARHLKRIRDEGADAGQSYRAQILLSQLQQFEKAVVESQGGPTQNRAAARSLGSLMAVADLAGLVRWIEDEQPLLSVAGLYYLNKNAAWERLLGERALPDGLKAGAWIEQGLSARIEGTEEAYLIYVHGHPRLALLLDERGRDAGEISFVFLHFLAMVLPLFVTTHLPGPIPVAGIRHKNLIARDPLFLALLRLVAKAAGKDVTILLEGESGTGKEVLAEFIHAGSSRDDQLCRYRARPHRK